MLRKLKIGAFYLLIFGESVCCVVSLYCFSFSHFLCSLLLLRIQDLCFLLVIAIPSWVSKTGSIYPSRFFYVALLVAFGIFCMG